MILKYLWSNTLILFKGPNKEKLSKHHFFLKFFYIRVCHIIQPFWIFKKHHLWSPFPRTSKYRFSNTSEKFDVFSFPLDPYWVLEKLKIHNLRSLKPLRTYFEHNPSRNSRHISKFSRQTNFQMNKSANLRPFQLVFSSVFFVLANNIGVGNTVILENYLPSQSPWCPFHDMIIYYSTVQSSFIQAFCWKDFQNPKHQYLLL